MSWSRRSLMAALISGVAATLTGQEPGHPEPPPRPQTYGGSVVSYVRVPAFEFSPIFSGVDMAVGPGLTRYSTNCFSTCFTAPLHLPSGAKLVYLELDSLDTNATEYAEGQLWVCDPFMANCTHHPVAGAGPADCLAGGGWICSGGSYAGGTSIEPADLTPDGIVVDNQNKSYTLFASSSSFDGSTAIAGMLVGYVLQVSPPPASPTFNDVPTGHPFYQFIEALVASGVTAGCGGGKYCPDAPLTRGQMAVFLSKALGLQFP